MTESIQPDSITERLTEFMRLSRSQGFNLGLQENELACQIARHTGVLNRESLRWGLRSLVCSTRDDWDRFDDLFDSFWLTGVKSRQQAVPGKTADKKNNKEQQKNPNEQQQNLAGNKPATDLDRTESGTDDDENAEGDGSQSGASLSEHLMTTDFQFLTEEEELKQMEALAQRLLRRMRKRLIRRYAWQSKTGKADLRRTIRQSLASGGDPVQLYFRDKKRRLPRLVLICDVSRSMSMYSYSFMRFFRSLLSIWQDTHAFAFQTRLINVGDALSEQDLRKVREKMALISGGWSGGTKIGECLQTLEQDYSRLLNNRTVVIMVSDGLDAGEPEMLAKQMAKIKSRVRKIVWLNPLLGLDGYEPIQQGIQAALPYVDLFAPAHNLQSLLALEPSLSNL